MNRKLAASILPALLMATGGLGLDVGGPRERLKSTQSPKMPLTEEELEKLSGLSGKAKKLYVKELRKKYA